MEKERCEMELRKWAEAERIAVDRKGRKVTVIGPVFQAGGKRVLTTVKQNR